MESLARESASPYLKMRVLNVVLVGSPNVGKSTLANALSGKVYSISSHRPHTTQKLIHSVFVVKEDTQIIIGDTPGKGALGTSKSANKIHTILVVGWKELSQNLVTQDFDTIVINKCDTAPKNSLETITQQLASQYPQKNVFALSAKKNKGIEELKEFLWSKAKKGKWLYPSDVFTNQTEKAIVTEFTRQQLFRLLRQEVPYEVEIQTKSLTKTPKLWTIRQQIINNKASRKKIIIGKNGQMLKKIGIASSNNIQNHFKIKVNLFLEVL